MRQREPRPLKFRVLYWLRRKLPLEIFWWRWRRESWSQFGEDVVLRTLFSGQNNGFYVDVGAFNPIRFSNSYLFYKAGWRGVCIEPNPRSHQMLERYRPRDINLRMAVASSEGELKLSVDEELSRILVDEEVEDFDHVCVPSRPLADILVDYLPEGTNIDFINIDCEGRDADVLRSNDWGRFRPSVAVVEDWSEQVPSEIDVLMEQYDYDFLLRLGLSKFFLAAEFKQGRAWRMSQR